MAFSASFENSLLLLIFENMAIANVGTTAGLQPSSSNGSFYIALHTADPTSSGNQSSNEATYTGYARVAVGRVNSGTGWAISGNVVQNALQIQFGQCTALTNTLTNFSIGLLSTGAGVIVLSGTLTSPIAVSSGITPLFAAGALQATLN
jgi:hypothetical protein